VTLNVNDDDQVFCYIHFSLAYLYKVNYNEYTHTQRVQINWELLLVPGNRI